MDINMGSRRVDAEIEVDLLEVFDAVLSRIWQILGVGLLAALICFAVSKYALTPYYDSTTKIYILNKADNVAVTYSDVQMGTQLTKDYAELISSRYVLEEVIQKLSLEEDYKALVKKVSINTPADTRIVSITVEDEDPVQAMNTANCIREVASRHIQNIMDIEAVNVVETANMPAVKAGPSVAKWTMFGGAAGIFLAVAIVILRYFLDDTIKSSEDVEKYLGLSTLALIPVVSEEGNARKKKKKYR